MSETIPADLDAVVDAVRTIAAEFSSDGAFRYDGENRWHCDINVADQAVAHAIFLLDSDGPLLAVYVMIRLPGALARIDSLVKAVAHANNGLLPGCFEIDLETGEMHYRSALAPVSNAITPREVAHLLGGALLMSKTYAPAFQKIAANGADPIQAINEIEND
ncbi:MAG TPA: hypothetical protein VHP99_15065 [Pyrinomonadaceae bacterium]|nr:hypothetical protein [Pyrinomonadaceae bacterium]